MDKKLYDFLEFEKKEILFKRKYRKIYYWQSIRTDIVRTILYNDTNKQNDSVDYERKKKYISNISSMIKGCFWDIRNSLVLKKCDILYFDQQIYRYIDGKAVDSHFDFFDVETKYSVQRCFYLSHGNTKEHAGKGVGIASAELIQGFFYTMYKKIPQLFVDVEEDKFIDGIIQRISQQFEISIPVDELKTRIRDAVIYHKVFEKYYSWLLKKVRPKAIVVVCHYETKLYPLYGVAQKYNIPVIELEHGLICNHDAYNYLDLSPEGKELPNYFLTYGEFWNRYIQLPDCMKAIAVGNPFFEYRSEKYKDIKHDEKKVVFYSDEITGREQARFAIDFYQEFQKDGYEVYFKFHPTEYHNWRERYQILVEHPEINIVPKEKDLYELLAEAKHHVSVASTVLFESAAYDVKRYVMIKPGWIQYIQPLIDLGLAKGFHNMNEFTELIKEETVNKRDLLESIWKTNAKENGLKVIGEIINANGKER